MVKTPPAASGSRGALAEDLFDLGIDVITTGNHIWDKREIIDYFQRPTATSTAPPGACCARPTMQPDLPGWGVYEGLKNNVPYAVINLQGRVFMASNDDPFRIADKLLKRSRPK